MVTGAEVGTKNDVCSKNIKDKMNIVCNILYRNTNIMFLFSSVQVMLTGILPSLSTIFQLYHIFYLVETGVPGENHQAVSFHGQI